MSDERAVVNGFNRYFEKPRTEYTGVSFRRKQHRFTSQFCDVLVLSPDIADLVIEHKSFKTDNTSKLYWSQHFSSDTDDNMLEATHQVKRVEEFNERAGKKSLLAAEVRFGPGSPRKLFFIDWEDVVQEYEAYQNDESGSIPGFSVEWMEENCVCYTTITDGAFNMNKEILDKISE